MGKILIIFPGALGDILLALPVIQAIKHRFPTAVLDFVGDVRYFGLLKCTFLFNSCFDFNSSDFITLFSPTANYPAAANFFRSYDLAIVWLRCPGSEKQLADKLKKYGIRTVIINDPNPQPHPPIHHTRYLLNSVKQLLESQILVPPYFRLTGELQQFARSFFLNYPNRRWVVVHPGSGSPCKNWSLENFAAVINQLNERGRGVLVPIGPAERSNKELLQKLCGRAVFVENLAIEKLAALFSRCSACIGNDSGISHLAALVGIPTLVLFVGTNPAIWAPWGKNVFILAKDSTIPITTEQTFCLKLPVSNTKSSLQIVECLSTVKVIHKVIEILEGEQTSY